MNQIIAGMLWLLCMQERTIPVAIDLCDLHLDMIEEDEEAYDWCYDLFACTGNP